MPPPTQAIEALHAEVMQRGTAKDFERAANTLRMYLGGAVPPPPFPPRSLLARRDSILLAMFTGVPKHISPYQRS